MKAQLTSSLAGLLCDKAQFPADLRPTAAAIAYGLDKKGSGERNVLIYDTWRLHHYLASKFESSSTPG